MTDTTTTYADAVAAWEDCHPYGLAHYAGCMSPDAGDSPGGEWLDTVRRVALDRAEDMREDGTLTDECAPYDVAREEANSLVPVYTWPMWRVFTDLGAWDEDVADYGHEGQDMTALAGLALYAIAERLVSVILEDLADAATADADATDGEA